MTLYHHLGSILEFYVHMKEIKPKMFCRPIIRKAGERYCYYPTTLMDLCFTLSQLRYILCVDKTW